jgi:thiol-disulfide isomerase/thioredoxin
MILGRRSLLALAASLPAALDPRKPRAGEPTIGQLQLSDPPRPVPALHWTDAAGAQHGLAEYAGRGVVLNFWATWCGPCVAEMPSLAALAGLLAGKGIVVLPVSNDSDGAGAVRAFYAAHHIAGLGVWLDPQGDGLQAVGGAGLPTTLIVDRKGREVARIAGAADWAAAGTAETVGALCDN